MMEMRVGIRMWQRSEGEIEMIAGIPLDMYLEEDLSLDELACIKERIDFI